LDKGFTSLTSKLLHNLQTVSQELNMQFNLEKNNQWTMESKELQGKDNTA